MAKVTRVDSEQQTIEVMINLYCKQQHGEKDNLCRDCQELLQYARSRLTACKFAEDKPTCGQCPIHCYKPDMREKITKVMRFSGPRMLRSHPVMALRHWLQRMKQGDTGK